MRWIRTILGVALILAAGAAMYYWSSQGRTVMAEDAAAASAAEVPILEETVEEVPSWKQTVLEGGRTFFPLDKSCIGVKSRFVEAGDWVGVYVQKGSRAEKLGQYEVAYVDEENLEILCDIDTFVNLQNMNHLIFAIEEKGSNE